MTDIQIPRHSLPGIPAKTVTSINPTTSQRKKPRVQYINHLVAFTDTLTRATRALTTILSNVVAMSLTAESISRGQKAAADAPLVDSVSGLQLRSRVQRSHLGHGLEEILFGVLDLGRRAALALRVACADGVSGAAVPWEAPAAVVVALVLADEIAGAVTADGAGGRVVAPSRGDGCVGQEGSEEFAGEVHFEEEFWMG